MISNKQIREIDELPEFADRVHRAALAYAREGIYVIPVMKNDKSLPYPKEKYAINYTDATINPETVNRWYGKGGLFRGFNIGIACGNTGGVFALDIDLEDKNGNHGYESLKRLEAQHGKIVAPAQTTPSGGMHYLFKWDESGKSSTGKVAPAIDTRGGSADQCKSHIVAYPSTRGGLPYQWVDVDTDMHSIPPWLSDTMGGSWGAQSMSKSGRGNEQMDDEDVETKYTPRQISKMLDCIQPDDMGYTEWLNVIQAVHSQHPNETGLTLADNWSRRGNRYTPGEVAIRWAAFREDGDIRVGSLIYHAKMGGFDPVTEPRGADIPSDSIDDVVDEYNETYGVVPSGSGLRIIRKKIVTDPFRSSYDMWSHQTFRLWCEPDKVILADASGNSKPRQKADIWFGNTRRREYAGITFEPGTHETEQDDYFNVWRGWAVEPVQGDWSLFKEHLLWITGGKVDEYEWLMNWMADALQDPKTPKGCAVVMKGNEGTGKGTVANIFGKLFGIHYKHLIQENQLVGNFNGHMEGALLVFADEVVYGGNKKAAGALKGLVTERSIMIERKGEDAIPFNNCIRLMMASNEEWVVPAGNTSRRWYVVELPNLMPDSTAYFNKLYDQMNKGGYSAMMYELMNRELSDDDISSLMVAPKTDALLRQREISVTSGDTILTWWAEKVENGVNDILSPADLEEVDWADRVDKMDAYDNYREYANKGKGYVQSKIVFGSRMEGEFQWKRTRPKNGNGVRHVMYVIPPHEVCIELMAKAGILIKITGEEE